MITDTTYQEHDVFEALSGTIETTRTGAIIYRNSRGQRHRVGGPAVIYASGTVAWYHNGRRHRIGGPAVIFADGSEHWYQNDVQHRTDGPAIRCADGFSAWFLNDKAVTEEEFNACIKSGNYDEPGSPD